MKPLHYILVAVVMASGLAISVLLVPGDSGLSLMYFRGHQFQDARLLYEKRLGAGDRSVDVVMPLAELYVQSGEVSRAVDLLRQVGTSAAERVELFQRVGTFQKYGQHMQEYLHTLEAINRIQSSEDGLRELANQFRYANDNTGLVSALQTLIARYPGEPAEYLELANLLAIGSRYSEAAGVLEQFETRHPQDVNPDTVEFLVSVLLDSSQGERALNRAARWLDRRRDSGGVARLAALLRTKGQPGLAAKLLAPFDSAVDGDPVLLAEWLQLQVGGGRIDAAFERLDRLRRRNLLPDDLLEPFLSLALAKGDVALAIEVADQHGFHRLNGELLGRLAERALATGRESSAYRMVAALGEGFLAVRPLLAARLAYARGDRTEATRRLQAIEGNSNLSDGDRFTIAGLDVSLGRRLEAVAQLNRLRIESAPEDLLLEIARLYIAADKAGDGVDRFEGLRARRSTPAIDRGWALVAAGGGRGSEVTRWIEASPAPAIPAALLRDLYFIAQDHKQADLALAASNRLFLELGGDRERLMLARALTAAGKPAKALTHARTLLAHSRDPAVEEVYTAALLGAIRSSPLGADGLQGELRSYWTAKLSQSGQDDRQRLEIVYGLLEFGAADAALPYLEALARQRDDLATLYLETAVHSGHQKDAVAFLESDLGRKDLPPETREARVYALIEQAGQEEALPYIRQLATARLPHWVDAYEAVLNKLGRNGDLVDFWRARLAEGSLTPDEKRAIGFKLIDAGRQDWARSVFGELAQTAPPDHADVAEYLFLWGPKPPAEALDWLEHRARQAKGADRTAWLSRLLDAGAPARVAAIVADSLPPAGQGGTLLVVYLRALAERHETKVLANAATREAAALADRDRVRRLAGLVRDLGGISAAEPAYARLLVLDPTDGDALHWLGVAAYGRAQYSIAARHLGALLASSEGGYDDNFYYAEMLWRRGDRTHARAYYGRALRLIERMPLPPPEAYAAHAQALFRCGNTARALREYRTLVAVAPRNGELRADFGAMLLEAMLYDEADEALSGGVDSGAVRIGLLRAQLLTATARRAAALELVKSLIETHPDLANVVAALGSGEQSVGLARRAWEDFDRAVGMDPDNEDVRGARSALEEERAGQFRTEGESRRIQGAQSEDLLRIAGERLLSKAFRFQFAVEEDNASVRSLRYADGRIAPYDGVRRRGEAALEWESEGGMRVKGILFEGASPGGGLVVTRPDPNGASAIQVDFSQPYWDLSESLAQGGVRDRVELRRESILSQRVSVRLSVAANRYSLPDVPGAAESIAASGNVNIKLLRQPQIALDYIFDGEYGVSAKTRGAAGGEFQPIPLVSRELHTAGVHVERQVTRGLRLEGAAGMTVDRLGGSAPFWSVGVGYNTPHHLGARIDFDRRLYTLDSTRIVTTFRVGLLWRF